jgi:NTE family protein
MTGRALVLAGGGIRVAWQTGVVQALDEAGLTFDHGDGTSGGIFTLGMLLCGLEPAEMAERWRSLDVRGFMSLLPARAYLRSPTNWAAFGGAQGVRRRVLPHLGIDVGTVRRATAMTGAFNVADFAAKQCVAIPHTEIDEDRLVAGVSLAGVMPAVRHAGRMWTDAVWIKDANLTETVRRGCTELWVVWCIGNTPRWGTGALEQYVHMIEMSATGGLLSELEWIADLNARRRAGEPVLGSTDPVLVHLIKPPLPLPLDPDFVAGRIDAETLIAMGYRDALRYLEHAEPGGIPVDDDRSRLTATQTPARSLGARVVLRAGGRLDPGGYAECTLVVEADDLAALEADPGAAVPGVGGFQHPQAGYRPFATTSVELAGTGSARALHANAGLTLHGAAHTLRIVVPLPAGDWSAARTHRWHLTGPDGSLVGSGTGRMSLRQALHALTSFEPSGAHDLADRWRAVRLTRRVLRHGGRSLDRPAAEPAAELGQRR